MKQDETGRRITRSVSDKPQSHDKHPPSPRTAKGAPEAVPQLPGSHLDDILALQSSGEPGDLQG